MLLQGLTWTNAVQTCGFLCFSVRYHYLDDVVSGNPVGASFHASLGLCAVFLSVSLLSAQDGPGVLRCSLFQLCNQLFLRVS